MRRAEISLPERQVLKIAARYSGGWQPQTPTQWRMARDLRERGLLEAPSVYARFTASVRGLEALRPYREAV